MWDDVITNMVHAFLERQKVDEGQKELARDTPFVLDRASGSYTDRREKRMISKCKKDNKKDK